MPRPLLRRVLRQLIQGLIGGLIGILVVYVAIHHHERLELVYSHYAAHRVTTGLPYVDRMEVNLLAPVPFESIAPDAGFPISGYGTAAPVIETAIIHSSEARKLGAIWRHQDFLDPKYAGLCHDGVYGLRFYHGNVVLLETSVCFHCHNFYLPLPVPRGAGLWWGFDADSERGRELWAALDTLAPYALRKPAEDAFLAEKQKRNAEREATSATRERSGATPPPTAPAAFDAAATDSPAL